MPTSDSWLSLGGACRPAAIAHRGASALAPENTRAAFESAIAHGAFAIETDIRMTRDGHLVCHHDSDLRRLAGIYLRIEDLPLADLRCWSAHDVPTLDEMLDCVTGRTAVLLDLKRRARDVRGFVHALEGWVIATLGDFGVDSWRAPGRIGIWTRDADGREAKIGAIGVRIRRWVTMHGFSVNLAPDLAHFGGIVPCGIEEFGVTSLARLGLTVDFDTWDRALIARADEFLAALERACPGE